MGVRQEVKDDTVCPVDNNINKSVADAELKSVKADSVEDLLDDGVRTSVPSTDVDVPASTFRAWTMGILFTMITNGLNQLFTMHNPPMVIAAFVIVLISYPIGVFLARILPTRKMTLFGHDFSLNPGPFNHKEHTIIAVMIIGTSSFNSNATAADVYTAFIKYLGMGEKVTIGYRLLFLLSSQALAFGLGGIFQRIVVDPAYCVWPSILPTCALIHGFHDGSFFNFQAGSWKMSRMRFFWITLCCATVYQFFPSYIFTALSTFAWVTWIAPHNRVVNQVFGSTTGLDLIPITFDWNQIIAYLTSPLPIPTWAIANLGVSIIVILWIITPAMHWSNAWFGLYLPVSSSSVFDNTGASYDVSNVLNPDFTLNPEAYHAYSPVFLSTTTILAYSLSLASVVAVLVHSYLHHREAIWAGLRETFKPGSVPELQHEDIHSRMMRAYKPTPTWWYAASLLLSVALSIGFLEGYDTGVRWWAMILALVIQLITVIPIAIMTALCNQVISLGVPGGIIGGALFPGNMEATVLFKVFLYVPIDTAVVLLRDQKLGHYMKVPPRAIFMAQLVGIIVSWVTQIGVNTWALNHIAGVCTTSATYICPIARSFESSIIFWGLIGPNRLFGPGSMYSSILYWLIPGAILPVIAWFAAKKFPNSFAKHVHIPLMMSAASSIPPATAINFVPWTLVGLFFNWFVKRRWNAWWLKYNYMLSASLDGALGIATFLIFFCLYYPGVVFNWWGNVGAFETADVEGLAIKSVGVNETFGPSTWR